MKGKGATPFMLNIAYHPAQVAVQKITERLKAHDGEFFIEALEQALTAYKIVNKRYQGLNGVWKFESVENCESLLRTLKLEKWNIDEGKAVGFSKALHDGLWELISGHGGVRETSLKTLLVKQLFSDVDMKGEFKLALVGAILREIKVHLAIDRPGYMSLADCLSIR